MALRRGFKTWSESEATRIRALASLRSIDPLPVTSVAKLLHATIWRPEDVVGLPCWVVTQLTVTDPTSWSALTLRVNDRPLVILNSAHSPARQASSAMHEFAHELCKHTPGVMRVM